LNDEEIIKRIAQCHDFYVHKWRETSFNMLADKMHKLADLLEKNTDRLAKIQATEMGKIYSNGKNDVIRSAKFCRHYAETSEKTLQNKKTDLQLIIHMSAMTLLESYIW
jgi:acyl-CoA reductase-like NAD-dependent aldehyde dehydrogenase